MMSLFNSFDLKLNMLPFSTFYLIVLIIFYSYFNTSIMSELEKTIKNSMKMSIYSDKTKVFSKFIMEMMMFIFLLIMLMNLSSIFSFNFPITSQIWMVFPMSLMIYLMIMMMSMSQTFNKLIYHLIPENSPLILCWFLFLTEIISNLVRPITLSVRLIANITAGHLLMVLISEMVIKYYTTMFLLILLNLMEFIVSMIQSYIFMMMILLYYKDM